jgi:ribosome-associated protein
MEHDVEIRSEMIRLGQLLKLAGLIDAGGQAAAFLATTPVRVNGEPEQRRGRQLHAGDAIRIGDETLRLTRRSDG